MPRDILNTEDFESTVQRRVLGRIFLSVDTESRCIESVEEYRSGRIEVRFMPLSDGTGVTRIDIR